MHVSHTIDAQYQEAEQHIQQCNFSRALKCCERHVFAEPPSNDVYWLVTYGWCLYKLNVLEEATATMKQRWEFICTHIAQVNYLTFSRLYDYFWAIAEYESLRCVCELRLKEESHPDLLRRCALVYSRLTDYSSAIDCYSAALNIEHSASTAYNLGVSYLQAGRYAEGLPLYEYRFDVFAKNYLINDKTFSIPRWQGDLSSPSSSLDGKGLIVWAEQGLGDVIQFARYISLLAEKGAYLLVLLPAAYRTLVSLLETVEGVGDVVTVSDNGINLPKPYHYHLPLMSAMHHCGFRSDTIPASVPYLRLSRLSTVSRTLIESIDAKRVKFPRVKRVGIVWSTQQDSVSSDAQTILVQHIKHEKSIPFSQLNTLLAVESVQFVNLKYPLSPAEKIQLQKNTIDDFSDHINDFTDTAVLIGSLDLIVSIDTAVAHLAGALAKPVINMLPYDSDWRWQKQGSTTPWYPTMTLYRQKNRDDWSDVLHQVAEQVKSLC